MAWFVESVISPRTEWMTATLPENKPPRGDGQRRYRKRIHSEYVLRQRAIIRPLSVVEIPNSIVDSPMPKIPKSTMGRRPITSCVHFEYCLVASRQRDTPDSRAHWYIDMTCATAKLLSYE